MRQTPSNRGLNKCSLKLKSGVPHSQGCPIQRKSPRLICRGLAFPSFGCGRGDGRSHRHREPDVKGSLILSSLVDERNTPIALLSVFMDISGDKLQLIPNFTPRPLHPWNQQCGGGFPCYFKADAHYSPRTEPDRPNS